MPQLDRLQINQEKIRWWPWNHKRKQNLPSDYSVGYRAIPGDWDLDSPPRKKKEGKVGELRSIWTREREFKHGNKRWKFFKYGVDDKPAKVFDNPEAYIFALQKHGFRVLGTGAYSTVLGKNGYDRVIKVNRRPDNWIDYCRWAAKIGQAGKFAPQVFSYRMHSKKKNFSVSIVERLEYTMRDAPEEHKMQLVPDLLYRAKKNEMAQTFLELLAPGLKDFHTKLKEEFPAYLDLHNGNMMLRKDGSFVVMDPVCGGCETQEPRLRLGDFVPPVRILCKLLLTSKRMDYEHLIRFG